MKTILIISYYFPPEGGGGVQRILKFLKYAADSEFKFKIITSSTSGVGVKDSTLLADINKNIEIIRIKHTLLNNKINTFSKSKDAAYTYETSYFKRILSSLFYFPDSRKSWIKKVIVYVNNNLNNFKNINYIFATIPPFSSGIIAKKISKTLNIPYILDYRDGWLYNPFQLYITPIHFFIHKIMEKNILNNSYAIVFVNNYLLEKYQTSYKSIEWNKKRTQVIHNGYDEEDIPIQASSSQINKINIGLPGTVYFRTTRPLNLLNFLKNNRAVWNNKIKFHLIGKWTKAFENKIISYNLNSFFEFHSYLPHKEYLTKLLYMDYNFLFLENNIKNINCLVPGRFFELLKLKTPFVMWGPTGHETEKITNSIGGDNYYLENSDINIGSFFNNIEKYNKNKLANNEELAKFDRKNLTEKLIEFIKTLN